MTAGIARRCPTSEGASGHHAQASTGVHPHRPAHSAGPPCRRSPYIRSLRSLELTAPADSASWGRGSRPVGLLTVLVRVSPINRSRDVTHEPESDSPQIPPREEFLYSVKGAGCAGAGAGRRACAWGAPPATRPVEALRAHPIQYATEAGADSHRHRPRSSLSPQNPRITRDRAGRSELVVPCYDQTTRTYVRVTAVPVHSRSQWVCGTTFTRRRPPGVGVDGSPPVAGIAPPVWVAGGWGVADASRHRGPPPPTASSLRRPRLRAAGEGGCRASRAAAPRRGVDVARA